MDVKDTFGDRLKQYIATTGLNDSQFADSCGIPRPSLSQVLANRNKKISDELIGKIHRTYPSLSIMWLMFGEGSMLTGEDSERASICTGQRNNGEINLANAKESETQPPIGNEDIKMTGDMSGSCLQPNHIELGNTDNTPSGRINAEISASSKILDLQRQIEKLQVRLDKTVENPRKVTQITVYYDDSTFETFVPTN